MNIVFWNCQGLRPKRKELQNYLLENQIDILALNETFLKPKIKFHLPGYDIYKNDRFMVGTKGGVTILVKKGISSRDISFSVADDHMGSDHFPIQISLDKPLKRNTPRTLTEPRYQFDK